LHEGESVLAIGAPQGLELSLTNGIISAFRNSEKKFLIQNTAPIAPGSSGGPLLDSRGRVVGLTTSLLADTPGVYFSIGIGAVKKLLKAAPTLSQSFATWTAQKGVQARVSAEMVCSFIINKMMSALPAVPTNCFVKEGGSVRYELRVFSPTEVLEGKMRRAWSTAFFLTAQALFVQGALNSTCEFSREDEDWYGCKLDLSDSFLSEHKLYYGLWLDRNWGKMNQQMTPDPSSDDWYRLWWTQLLAGKELSDPRLKSKENAEWRAQDACKDYIRVGLYLSSVPTCSLLLVTDSSVFAVVDFPDLLYAMPGTNTVPLLATFGRHFANSGYDGAVIFRSPWTTGASPARVYDIYPLHSIEFWWEEVNSGVREKAAATLHLEGEMVTGQTDRNVFSSAPKGVATLRFAAIVRIIPGPTGHSLLDLTDGSEWSITTDSQNRCKLNEGIDVLIFSEGGTHPSLSSPAPGGRCPLDAVFVKGW
jgi:Trypsin-like peptidase domain